MGTGREVRSVGEERCFFISVEKVDTCRRVMDVRRRPRLQVGLLDIEARVIYDTRRSLVRADGVKNRFILNVDHVGWAREGLAESTLDH